MTAEVTWRDAVFADRAALTNFVCTDAVKRSRWNRGCRVPAVRIPELIAQGAIRNMQPPAGRSEMMLVGEDDEGIVAVAWTDSAAGPHDVFVKVIAVATRARGQGHKVSDALFSALVDRHLSILLASDSDEPLLIVTGKVDPENQASRAFCERYSADVVDVDEVGSYDYWLITVSRPDF